MAARAPAAPNPPARDRGARLLLAALFAVAVALYAWCAHRASMPTVFPDEYRYSQIASSLVHGDGFTWSGRAVDQTAALYVYAIAPLWALFASPIDARAASQLLGCVTICAQVVPVWLVARTVMTPRRALIPAALAVAGTWMTQTALVMTEALAFPLATATLCVTVLALRRPGSRLALLALGLALLTTWARIQLVVLVPVVFGAFAVDVLLAGDGAARRARAREHRTILAVGTALLALVALVAVAAPSLMGDYASVKALRPPIGTLVQKAGLQLLELVVVSGFAPVLVVTAASLLGGRRLWRDPRTGPLLIVLWLAVAALAFQGGYYLAGAPMIPSGIERYVVYPLPLALILFTLLVVERALVPRGTWALAAALALLLPALPRHPLIGIEAATWATGWRMHQLLGLANPVGIALAGALVVGAGWAARRWLRGTAAVAVGLAVVFGALAVQDHAQWRQMWDSTSTYRSLFPGDLRWIDERADGPVALLVVAQNSDLYNDIEYYNKRIVQAFEPSSIPAVGRLPEGRTCDYAIGETGVLRFAPGCGAVPQRLLVADRSVRVTFHDEAASFTDGSTGRVASLAPGAAPRLRSILSLPCPEPRLPIWSGTDDPAIRPASTPRPCSPALGVNLWLDAPARLTLRFAGGDQDEQLSVGGRPYAIRAGGITTIPLNVNRGRTASDFSVTWTTTPGNPRLVGAALRSADGRTEALL